MGLRYLLLLVGVALAFATPSSQALGIGEITLKSALNQPLDAEIKLLQVRELSSREIIVKLASEDDFQRLGVEKPFFLSDIRFKVDLNAPGGPMVRMTSKKLVREPFLNFIVQVQWPSGKLLREFTLLLDLPVFTGQPPTQVTGTQIRKPANNEVKVEDRIPASAQTPPALAPRIDLAPTNVFDPGLPGGSPFDEDPVTEAPTTADVYGPVAANETLWEIAAQARPDRDVSVQETMLAIQRLNPEAFINENINLLKRGQILRLPNQSDLQDTDLQKAVAQVARQNQLWNQDSGLGDDVQGAPVEARSVTSSNRVETDQTEGRVRLSSPSDIVGAKEGRSTGSGDNVSADALENELATTLEQLDTTSLENAELRSRVQALEEQIQTMEQLIQVSNEDLRSLELLAKNNAELEAAADSETVSLQPLDAQASAQNFDDLDRPLTIEEEFKDPMVQDAVREAIAGFEDDPEMQELIKSEFRAAYKEKYGNDASVDDSLPSELNETPVSEPVVESPVTPEEPVVSQPTKTVPSPLAKKGLIQTLLDNIQYIGVALIVIFGGIFFWYRKRAMDEFDDDDFLEQPIADDNPNEPTFSEQLNSESLQAAEPPTAPLSEEVEATDTVAFDAPSDEETMAVPVNHDPDLDFTEAELASPEMLLSGEEAVESPEAETGDVVAEADIYIAYGKYDQAEEMLLKGVEREPQNSEMHLKLLEVYAAQHSSARFDDVLSRLRILGTETQFNRGLQLRDSIPDMPALDLAAMESVPDFVADDPDDKFDSTPSLDYAIGDLSDDLDVSDMDAETALVPDASADVDAELDIDFGGDLGLDGALGDEGSVLDASLNLDDELDLDIDINEADLDTMMGDTTKLAVDTDDLKGSGKLEEFDDIEINFDEGLGDSAGVDESDSVDDILSGLEAPSETGFDDLDSELTSDLPEFGDLEGEASAGLDEGSDFDALLADIDASVDEKIDSVDDLDDALGLVDEGESGFALDMGEFSADIADIEDTPSALAAELDEETSGDHVFAEHTLESGFDSVADISADNDALSDDFDLEAGLESSIADVSGDNQDDIFADLDLGDSATDLESELASAGLDLPDELDSALLDDGSQEEQVETVESDEHSELDALLAEQSSNVDDVFAELGGLDETESSKVSNDENLLSDVDASFENETLLTPIVKEDLLAALEAKQGEANNSESTFDDLDSLDIEGNQDALDDLDKTLSDIDSLSMDKIDDLSEKETALLASVDDLPQSSESDDFTSDLENDVKDVDLAVDEDTLFQEAIAEIPDDSHALELTLPNGSGDDVEGEFDFLGDSDEVATKLDLARAYIDMGDAEGAVDIIEEIMKEGNEAQRSEAGSLRGRLNLAG